MTIHKNINTPTFTSHFDHSAFNGNRTTGQALSITIGTGFNRALVVAVLPRVGGAAGISVTFAGVKMDRLYDASAPDSDTLMWCMVNPPSGAGDVIATFTGG